MKISRRSRGFSAGSFDSTPASIRYHIWVLKPFEQYLRKHHLVRPGQRVGVAVSGGADSVALVRAFSELASGLGIIPFVLHLNHSLRGADSDGDAQFVAELAAQLSLESMLETADVAAFASLAHLSLEAAGRRCRYAFFQRAAAAYRLDCVATAHTRDDQAETVLLRLLRGTGTSGLAGVHRSFNLSELAPAEQEFVAGEALSEAPKLIRPLLGITRQQVEEYLGLLGQPYRQDASNSSSEFLRNRVRSQLLPALESEYNPRLRRALCETAEIAAAETAFLDDLVTAKLSQQLNPELGIEIGFFQAQPLAMQRRILRRLCLPHGLALDFVQLENLREFTLTGHAGRFNLPRGFAADVIRDKLAPSRLRLIAPHELISESVPYCVKLPVPGSVLLPRFWNRKDMNIRVSLLDCSTLCTAYNREVLLNAARVGSCLTVRNLEPGDRFRPLHCGAETKVNRLLQELSIPSALRRSWPVALAGDSIVWVPGLPVAADFAWSPGDSVAVVVSTPTS